MSYFQFIETLDGWIAAHAPEKDDGLSAAEADGLWEMVRAG